MAKLTRAQIQDLAKKLIVSAPLGIRYSDLHKKIQALAPETPPNTITGSLHGIETVFPGEITKPSRGLYVTAIASAVDVEPPTKKTAKGPTADVSESDFYVPLSEWLQNDLDEATVARPLGGAGLKEKWGTPDVVAVYKSMASDLIKFGPEIVTVELKIDPAAPVVAFGQAIAYRLFSTKTYVAMPRSISEKDKDRLEALCMLFGIGLIFFSLDPKKPEFQAVLRAQRFSPDMFYVNEFAENLRKHDKLAFNILFT